MIFELEFLNKGIKKNFKVLFIGNNKFYWYLTA